MHVCAGLLKSVEVKKYMITDTDAVIFFRIVLPGDSFG